MHPWLSTILALFFVFMALPCFANDENDPMSGEAKASSRNSMKEVEKGNPILQQHMMEHLQKAAMYQAQLNFPMAAQEMQKANMLKQQMDQNDNSHQKNSDRLDTAVYTSDASQSQLLAPSAPIAITGGRGTAPASSAPAESLGKANTQSLTWSDSTKAIAAESSGGSLLPPQTTTATSGELVDLSGGETTASDGPPATGALQDLALIEASLMGVPVPSQAPNITPASNEPSVAAAPTPEWEPGTVPTPPGVEPAASLPIVMQNKKDAQFKKKSDRDKAEFWKKKKVKKQAKGKGRPKAKPRMVASKKKKISAK